MIKRDKAWQLKAIVFLCVWLIPVESEGKEVGRELDCQKDPACTKQYQQEKARWLECLTGAGLSEKKRNALSLKVERLGIRNLKKSEILIFDSKRKACHKTFSQALSDLKPGSNSIKQWPAPLDQLDRKIPDREGNLN